MEQIELAVEQRTVVGKQVHRLRRAGMVPAILYGRHVEKPILLQAEARAFNRVLAKAGTTHLLTLKIKDQATPHLALVREVQREPISGHLYHVDLLAVSLTEKIRLKVPVVVSGEAPPVERDEGIVLQALDEIEIECLPADLIETVTVDVSGLDRVGMEIKVSDLMAQLQKVHILADPDELVVRITPVREEKIEEVAPEAAEVEVITKGKVEEEEEGEEEK